MPTYRVHLPPTSALWIEVTEPDGTMGRVDLDATAAAYLASVGHGRGAGPEDGVALGTLCCEGPVRFFVDGRRVATVAGLEAVSGGIVAALKHAVQSSNRYPQ